MRGSDIETPNHTATLKLRDALEKQIPIANRANQLNKGKSAFYIPNDVALNGVEFRYEVLLVDSDMQNIRSTSGKCDAKAIDTCAREIFRKLH